MMKMRSEFLKRKEVIAGITANTDEKVLGAQMEAVYDMMVDIHKEFIDSGEANDIYCDFFNRTDPAYVPVYGDSLFASLKVAYGGYPVLTTVEVTSIFPTGLVEFQGRDRKPQRLYSDELMNYREKKVNAVDSRDTPLIAGLEAKDAKKK